MTQRKAALSLAAALLLAACAPNDAGDEPVDAAADDETESALDEEISETWSDGPGYGVGFRRAGEGDDIVIFYGGYGATLKASEAWLDEAYAVDLVSRGVGRLYAVKGPLHADYRDYEIGNSKIAKRLVGDEGARAKRVVVIAHSSGAFVAHELLGQLADGRDSLGNVADKIVYSNLDGAVGPSNAAIDNLAGAWAVSVRDTSGTRSMNAGAADENASRYGARGKGGLHEVKAAAGVCYAGARWCLHMAATNERPHNKAGLDVARDYTDFEGRPIQLAFLAELDAP